MDAGRGLPDDSPQPLVAGARGTERKEYSTKVGIWTRLVDTAIPSTPSRKTAKASKSELVGNQSWYAFARMSERHGRKRGIVLYCLLPKRTKRTIDKIYVLCFGLPPIYDLRSSLAALT